MSAKPLRPARTPLVRVIDLDIGETQEVNLCDGTTAAVKLLNIRETRDGILSAVFDAEVNVEVNGQAVTLKAALYNLPTTAEGVRIDCSITRGSIQNSHMDHWGLLKDARLRLWPAGSPLIDPDTFVYPVKQRWFACGTWMANEPVSPRPNGQHYCHAGLDIGGAEGLVDVVSATRGLIITSGGDVLPGYEGIPTRDDTPMKPGTDIVTVLDDRDWCHRYVHLQSIDPAISVGQAVRIGQKVGILGKEGTSGGWAHLHYEIKSLQPSGKWGTQEAYAFIHGAYQRQYGLKLMAVAQPRYLAWTGQTVMLNAARSWSATGKIARYDWTFTDGSTASGPCVDRTYDRPGTYSEILKITDEEGRTACDFARVTVLGKAHPGRWPPRLHPAYAPTLDIRPGDPVTFHVRAFNTTEGHETWDFGDNSPPVTVQSDGNVDRYAPDGYASTVHRYSEPGDYLARVERSDQNGIRAVAHLHVRVGAK